ncbi:MULTISPECIES: hypothetical protein [Streptomyces]|uniref:Secreted protein n=1 Tax=Streptomyces cadmiisoli TaxID=2184053 RepID=A0A2Z4J811_9ACTN|nr:MULTISPECIES: hypothetical protein [Streptomyces]AWW41284.1 hypothetical protein DN051_35230 [Streptomyces cadmiisoli]KOV69513.1 hypothetical protein ADL00_11125 [Streptomyces sp. AS58]
MRQFTISKVVTFCAAATLVAAMGTASAAPSGTPSAASAPAKWTHAPVLVDCFWKSQVRPEDFILACGDGNSRLTKLDWSHWNRRSAVARGLNAVNDCLPYCAAGRFHSYAVKVRLDRPEAWERHPDLKHYTRITLTYPHDRPERVPRTVTYSLWN